MRTWKGVFPKAGIMSVKQLCDCEGLTVTCTNEDALQVYNEMLLLLMPTRKSALSLVESVLELDPGFVLAHCALVGLSSPAHGNYL